MYRALLYCGLSLWLWSSPTLAQVDGDSPNRVTLKGWVHDLRVAAWDRAGSAGGRYFDRGVFHYRTPRMDHEYDLDMFTVGFTMAEDAAFYAFDNGFRSRAISVTTSDFATQTQIHATTALSERIALRIDSDLQDDLQARRLALRLGYEMEVAEGHTVGLTHSLARAKADMDMGGYYRFENGKHWAAEVEVIALDGLNNIIGGLTASPFNRDTLRHYTDAPFMLSSRVSVPVLPRIRGEAAFGVQPRAKANIRSLNHDSLRFNFEDAFSYAGLLLEVEAWPGHITSGAVAKFTSSTSTRTADADARRPANYVTRQAYSRLGAFALGNWGKLHAETFVYFDHYADEQEGELFGGATVDGSYLFEEQRTWIRAKIGAMTPIGVDASLAYQADLRTYPEGEGLGDRYYAFIPHRPNHRLTLSFSLPFSQNAVLDGGTTFDLDNDHFFPDPRSRSHYDGTYLRLRANW